MKMTEQEILELFKKMCASKPVLQPEIFMSPAAYTDLEKVLKGKEVTKHDKKRNTRTNKRSKRTRT
jgi:hypothetical protein